MEALLAILGLVPVAEAVTNSSGGGSMMGGIPMELITMLGSSILGGVMSIWGQSIKAKEANNSLEVSVDYEDKLNDRFSIELSLIHI